MARNCMDLLELLRKRGMDGEVDFLRKALPTLVEGIMDAEALAQIGAHHGERSPDRLTHCNGYRSRDWYTRVGTIGWVRWNCASRMRPVNCPVSSARTRVR